jgi:hypothetical protein
MGWDLAEIWEYSVVIKCFIYIFFFAFIWLFYYFFNHYILVAKLKKHFKLFGKLRTVKMPDTEIGPIIDQQLNKAKNPQIKDLYRAFSALTGAPLSDSEHLAQKHKREIDYFLAKRKLQLKGLAVVLIFSISGLILVGIKELVVNIDMWYTLTSKFTLHQMISNLSLNFHYNLFYPLAIALAEAFLVVWLINSIKKLRLWLDREWANLLEESASGEGK